MKSVASIIQGNERLLFWRIYYCLQAANVSKRCLNEFESHSEDCTDDLIELAYRYLPEIGYYV